MGNIKAAIPACHLHVRIDPSLSNTLIPLSPPLATGLLVIIQVLAQNNAVSSWALLTFRLFFFCNNFFHQRKTFESKPNIAVPIFNLSDIFEYMSPDVFADVYGHILASANPGARLVYWNMMASRCVPPAFANRIIRQKALADRLKQEDKAFFYSDFVVEDVI